MRLVHLYLAIVAAVTALFVSQETTAQEAPVYFRDSFMDGDITDGQPVTWSDAGLGGEFDPSSGDLELTPVEQSIVVGQVEDATYKDVLTKTRALVSSSRFDEVGLWVRGIDDVGVYRAGISGDLYTGPGATGASHLFILKATNDGATALGITPVPVDLDASESDIELALEVTGDQLSLKAWDADENEPPDAQLTVQDDSLPVGTIGLYFLGDTRFDDSATFRYFQAVPEPSAAILCAFGIVGVIGWLRRRHLS